MLCEESLEGIEGEIFVIADGEKSDVHILLINHSKLITTIEVSKKYDQDDVCIKYSDVCTHSAPLTIIGSTMVN